MRLVGAIATILLLAALLWTGCSDDVGSGGQPPANPGAAEVHAPWDLVEACKWDTPAAADEREVRQSFADPGSGEVRLLLSDSVVRPGEVLEVAVLNESPEDVRYGTPTRLETEDGEEVPIEGPYGFRAIGLIAPAGDVGACVSVPVPSSTPTGDFAAVLVDIGEPEAAMTVSAPVRVEGDPVRDPAWEVQLGEAGGQGPGRE